MSKARNWQLVVGASVVLAFVAASCTDDATDRSGSGAALHGKITVSAAASLTEAFGQIRDDFEAANPEAEIAINFGSSGQLSVQIQHGAPVDVAAFADTVPMATLAKMGLLEGDTQAFARNRLVIVTKPGNPANIRTLADLGDVGVVALCKEDAPCGKFADEILADAGVSIDQSSITRGQDVKATLSAVAEGDAVAGIVYVTDAESAKKAAKVDRVDIPDSRDIVAEYPIGITADAANPKLARAFVEYVLGTEGQAVLKDYGFVAP